MFHTERVTFIKRCDEMGKTLVDDESDLYWDIINGAQMKLGWNTIVKNI